MSTVIKIENLSKKYVIGHKKQDKYTALRDVIAHQFRGIGQRLRHPLSPNKEETNLEEFWALKDINLKINQGDRVGIIGRNGAGKSTLLKVLSRITEPTTGRISINGRVASLLEVGTGFHPELSGRENIFLNGAILGMSRSDIKRNFDEIVAFAEVERFLDTPVKRYSSGMYVRLAFAVAAHLEPDILIIDEVLAVGDTQFQKKCLNKMNEVSKEGKTIIFVSHNMSAIRAMCNRGLILKKGSLISDGATEESISKYIGNLSKSVFIKEWKDKKTAPQNLSTVLKGISICDNQGKQVDKICTDTPFNIKIDYYVKTDSASVGLNILFYDDENNCILASMNNHEKRWYGTPMQIGDYSSICYVPKNLLNNNKFNLSIIIFGKNFTDIVKEDRVLNIEIFDGTEVRGDYHGHYACSIRPMFDWITKKIEY